MTADAWIDELVDRASRPEAQVLEVIQCFVEFGLLTITCENSRSAMIVFRDGQQTGCWLLRSPRMRVWLANFWFRVTGQTATRQQLHQITDVLEGLAVVPALAEAAEGFEDLATLDPLIAVALRYADGKAVAELATPLFANISTLARKLGWLPEHEAEWPRNSNQMSKRLRENRHVLGHHGLLFKRKHLHVGTKIWLTPVDASSRTPSPVPSQVNPSESASLSNGDASDGSDAILGMVAAKFSSIFVRDTKNGETTDAN